jgi:hypothetical protein
MDEATKILLDIKRDTGVIIQRLDAHDHRISNVEKTLYGDDSDGRPGHKIKIDRLETDVGRGKKIVGVLGATMLGGVGMRIWEILSGRH